jgi:hypothetical protein
MRIIIGIIPILIVGTILVRAFKKYTQKPAMPKFPPANDLRGEETWFYIRRASQ